MAKKEKKKYIDKLRKKYRLIVYNDQTYEEVWSGKVSRMNIYSWVTILILLTIIVVFSILVFTPMSRLLPAYANSEMQQLILQNASRVDSVEHQIQIRDQYIEALKKVIRGEAFENTLDITNDKDLVANYTQSKHDSILRRQIEEEEQYNVSILSDQESVDFRRLHFFAPLKGIITNPFNRETKHFGIDIVAAPNKPISSTLDGTVIEADWTLATGYVIQIQHDNNLISIYKHNAVLFKQVGDHVKAGETIAILGNTGKYSTGPHLHFELWHNGTPLNPADYIVF